jgi:acetylglutamate kinase
MVDEELKRSFARDVCLLRFVGIQVVVVHGGGPQINDTLNRMGIESTFAGGMRITDDATMEVVEMVLAGGVNSDIVGLICSQGGRAAGLSGRDDSMILAERVSPVAAKGAASDAPKVDLGRVGNIKNIKPALVRNLIESGFVPVIAPIGVDETGATLNVNADTAAAAIAGALGASKLVLMTDVDGVKGDSGELLRSLGSSEAERLIDSGVIHSGMIPKVRCALDAVESGVQKVHILDGRQKHALLLEIFTDRGVGTEIHLEGS